MKLETGEGTVTLPVYEESDIGPDVYDMVRVMTENGVGVIPFTDEQEASYNFLRVKTENNGIIAAHDNPDLIGTLIVDNFEDNDLDEYGDSVDAWEITSEKVFEGNYALKDANGYNELISQNGLDNYPNQGEVFRASHYITEGSLMEVRWAEQGSESGENNGQSYAVRYRDGKMRIGISGSAVNNSWFNSQSIDTSNHNFYGVWTETEVEWHSDGLIVARIFEIEDDGSRNLINEMSVSNTNFSDGGISFQMSGCYVDNYRITGST